MSNTISLLGNLECWYFSLVHWFPCIFHLKWLCNLLITYWHFPLTRIMWHTVSHLYYLCMYISAYKGQCSSLRVWGIQVSTRSLWWWLKMELAFQSPNGKLVSILWLWKHTCIHKYKVHAHVSNSCYIFVLKTKNLLMKSFLIKETFLKCFVSKTTLVFSVAIQNNQVLQPCITLMVCHCV